MAEGGLGALFFLSGLSAFAALVPASASETAAVTHSVRYGNRKFVADVLKTVYGPESARVVDPGVLGNLGAFGGACDPYAPITVEKAGKAAVAENAADACPQALNESKLGPFHDSGTLRSLALTRVCEDLARCAPCGDYLARAVAARFPRGWESADAKLWLTGLFYAGKVKAAYAAKLRENALALPQAAALLCQSGLWQIP